MLYCRIYHGSYFPAYKWFTSYSVYTLVFRSNTPGYNEIHFEVYEIGVATTFGPEAPTSGPALSTGAQTAETTTIGYETIAPTSRQIFTFSCTEEDYKKSSYTIFAGWFRLSH